MDTFVHIKGNNFYKKLRKCIILESSQKCANGLQDS